MGIPAGGFKGDQDLDNGQAQGEGSSFPCGVGVKPKQQGRDCLAHTPVSSYKDISRTSANPGDKKVQEVGGHG